MRSTLAVIMAGIFASVVATGTLVIGFAAAAVSQGYTIADFYAETFPAFRSGHAAPVPQLAYAVFFAYVAAAAELAILFRRRMTGRSAGR